MNEILIANLTLDTYRKNNVPPLIVPQGDYGARVIRVNVTDQGKPVSVESTAAVSIVATRSGDGESLAFSGKANDDGSVTVPVTQWMLDVPDDDVICHVVVTGNGYQYSTTSFLIEPQEKANPTEITPDDPRKDVITEVLANENARQAAEATRTANENARKTAENSRQSAETQRLTDEANRVANEQQRVSAEASRDATFKSWANDIASLPSYDSRITRNAKEIENLKAGLPSSVWHEDNTVAYVKDVPENARQMAYVNRIGGMTRKCANLFDLSLVKNSSGIVERDDDRVTITGYIAMAHFENLTVGKTYCFSAKSTRTSERGGGVSIEFLDDSGATVGSGIYDTHTINPSKKFTIPSGTARVRFYLYGTGSASESGSATYINLMLNEGDAQPYEPYFEGLRSAKGTEVKSVGVNLISFPFADGSKTTNGITFKDNDDGSLTINGTALVDLSYTLVRKIIRKGTYTVSIVNAFPNNGVVMYLYASGLPNVDLIYKDNQTKTFVIDNDYTELSIYIASGSTFNNFVLKPMLVKGSTAQPYTPYVEHTLPIPEAVRVSNGINENVYDYIEWGEDGKQRKRVKCGVVDMGTLNWAYEALAQRFHADIPTMAVAGERSLDVLSDKFDADANVVPGDNWKGFCYKQVVLVYSAEYTDAASFKAAVSGSTLYYKLAEPIVTDISDLLPADNLIGVEGNGTLTFENEYGYAVPSEVAYQLKGETA